MIEVTKACKVDCFYESKGFLRCSIGKLGTCEPSLETFVVQLGTFVVQLGNWERVRLGIGNVSIGKKTGW